MESYTKLYVNKENYDAILNILVPCLTDPTLFEKWMCVSKIGQLIASVYDRVCIALIRYGFSENLFSLRSKPPQNPFEHIMRIGWL